MMMMLHAKDSTRDPFTKLANGWCNIVIIMYLWSEILGGIFFIRHEVPTLYSMVNKLGTKREITVTDICGGAEPL
jgi:hypothetical protein